jgi:hypothetical protein
MKNSILMEPTPAVKPPQASFSKPNADPMLAELRAAVMNAQHLLEELKTHLQK